MHESFSCHGGERRIERSSLFIKLHETALRDYTCLMLPFLFSLIDIIMPTEHRPVGRQRLICVHHTEGIIMFFINFRDPKQPISQIHQGRINTALCKEQHSAGCPNTAQSNIRLCNPDASLVLSSERDICVSVCQCLYVSVCVSVCVYSMCLCVLSFFFVIKRSF